MLQERCGRRDSASLAVRSGNVNARHLGMRVSELGEKRLRSVEAEPNTTGRARIEILERLAVFARARCWNHFRP